VTFFNRDDGQWREVKWKTVNVNDDQLINSTCVSERA